MATDYPAHMLRREPAPPFHGEGPFALWHYSEDPDLHTFSPHSPETNPDSPPYVWTVDTRHAPTFWFPRDCPRGCIWSVSTTTSHDRERFFGQSATDRVHVVEGSWAAALQRGRLYAYRLPTDTFTPHSVGGYWVSEHTVEAVERVEVANLIERHAEARIELRIVPSVWPFWRRVVDSTVGFSGSRLRNAGPHAEQLA